MRGPTTGLGISPIDFHPPELPDDEDSFDDFTSMIKTASWCQSLPSKPTELESIIDEKSVGSLKLKESSPESKPKSFFYSSGIPVKSRKAEDAPQAASYSKG